MILVDLSQTIIASIMVEQIIAPDEPIELSHIRYMTLNSLRKLNSLFKEEYGKMTLCVDGTASWRYDEFEFYKWSRKDSKKDSRVDWESVYDVKSQVENELDKYMPYRFVRYEKAEGDDVIGILTRYMHTHESNRYETVIVSRDKDFIQLQRYEGVSQYNVSKDLWIVVENPLLYLKEHILRGDTIDGIPNFLSPDDIFTRKGERQKSVFKKKIEKWVYQTPEKICGDDKKLLANYKRNRKLIDLSQIPEGVKATILDRVINDHRENGMVYQGELEEKMVNYFESVGLNRFMERRKEFL